MTAESWTEGKALWPMPTQAEIEQAFTDLGAPLHADRSRDALLRAATVWLADMKAWEAPVRSDEASLMDFHFTHHKPITAVWTAFRCYGLPTYQPNYAGWWKALSSEDWLSGRSLEHCSYTHLHLYVSCAERCVKWNDLGWDQLVIGGGLHRAAVELLRRVRKGQWVPQWN